jgi:hypothetical protein
MLDVIRGAFVPRAGRVLFAPCLVSAALAMACGGVGDLPADGPTVTPTTENFTETIQKNGAATVVFSEGIPGTISATITTLSPQTDISLSFSIGTWDGATCSVGVSNDAAIVNTTLTGDAAAGSFCARVSDTSGKVTGSENVGLTIVHY